MQQVTSTQVLSTLVLCGLMGLLGQGVRAAAGLKSYATQIGPNGAPTQQNTFNAAYFLVSLMVGFIAGILSGIAIGIANLMTIDPTDLKVLLGISAAGYAGTDFIENTFGGLIPGLGTVKTPVTPQTPDTPVTPVTPVPAQPPPLALPGEIAGLKAALRITAPKLNADTWTPALSMAFTKFGMTTHRRMAASLGQFLVEAGAAFQSTVENLNYTHAERIAEVFPHEIPTVAEAERFVGQPEALANFVYANRNGNGPEASGDGFRFRGRGLIQLTGRTEYANFAAAAGKTIDAVGAYCETPEGAAISGCWYLVTNNCLPLADNWELARITRVVNGPAMSGAAQRSAYSEEALKALGK